MNRNDSRILFLLLLLVLWFGELISDYSEFLLVLLIILSIFAFPVIYLIWNHYRWNRIEELNLEVGITRENAYIDSRGYLRWMDSERLCHRDIAWKFGKRGDEKFGNCDIHHIDGNKFNNNSSNLEILTREEHQLEHGQLKIIEGKRYRKLARINKIYRETRKAILVAHT